MQVGEKRKIIVVYNKTSAMSVFGVVVWLAGHFS